MEDESPTLSSKVIGLQSYWEVLPNMNCLTGFAKTINPIFYLFFYIFIIIFILFSCFLHRVHIFLRNTLLQILLKESGLIEFKVYSKTDFFSRNSHHIKTSKLIYIADHLTGFHKIRVCTGRNFRSELWLKNTLHV